MINRAMLVVLFLFGCGGSGGVDVAIPAPATLRTDLYFGYYLTSPTQIAETVGHVNLIWVGGPWGVDAAITNMQAARLPAVLDVSEQMYAGTGHAHTLSPNAETALRALFKRLDSLDLLRYIAALYPIDEPDISVINSGDILSANRIVRKVAAEFQALANVKLAVIYSGASRLTYIEDFDWVGFDDYAARSEIFTNGEYAALINRLRPNQRVLLVPGGYIGQDPAPFINFAHADSRVIAIIPFLWTDTDQDKGIGSQPAIRRAYCLAGEQIKTPGHTGACA